VQRNAIWIVRGGELVQSYATIGIRGIERTEATSGLKAGNLVVVSTRGDLKPDESLRIGATLDPKAAADLNKPAGPSVFKGFN
jgi:hypothetical protein